MEKKGLSGVVTAVLLILISLFAIGIVFTIVKNLVSEKEKEISEDATFVNLEIQKVEIGASGVDVTIKRNIGEGNLDELKIVFSDGFNSEVFIKDASNLKELETQTYDLAYDGVIKEVSVLPVSSSGYSGNILDKLELEEKDILENLKLVSWWRFDEEVNDENVYDSYGNNNGILGGNFFMRDTSTKVYGKSLFLDGSSYVKVSHDTSLNLKNKFSIELWFNAGRFDGTNNYFLRKGDEYCFFQGGPDEIVFLIYDEQTPPTPYDAKFYTTLNTEKWYHLVFTLEDSEVNWYLNGILKKTQDFSYTPYTSDGNFYIGSDNVPGQFFEGWFDELRIYNKALSESEVEFLYKGGLNI